MKMQGKRTTLGAISGLVIAALLAGCGGGGSALPSNGGSGGGSGGGNGSKPQAKLTFQLNTHASSQARHRQYTSRATLGIGINYKTDGGPGTFPTTEAGMQSNVGFALAATPGTTTANSTCTSADGSGAFSCTVLLPIAPGYEDFQITTWDAAPSTAGFTGAFAATANDLSTNVVLDQRIVGNTTNDFDFTLNGVVSSVAMTITPNSLISGGGAQTSVLQVLASDADGNIIIGADPYVDVNGNTLTLTVTKGTETYPNPFTGPTPAPSVAGDVTYDAVDNSNCANGSVLPVVASTCTYTSPESNTASGPYANSNSDLLDYNGYEISTAPYTLSVTTSGPAIGSVTQSVGFTNSTDGPVNIPGSPTMLSLALPNSETGAAEIAAGGSGQQYLYVANFFQGYVNQILPGSAPTISQSWNVNSAIGGGIDPWGVAVGSDNNVFVGGGGEIAIINPSSGVIEGESVSGNYLDVTSGPDQNIYMGDNTSPGHIAEILVVGQQVASASGMCSVSCPFPVVATQATSSNVNEIVAGPDGNLWFTQNGSAGLGEVAPGLASPPTYYSIAGASHTYGIVAGPDGQSIYTTDEAANTVDQVCAVATCGSFTKGQLMNSWTLPYQPKDITVGSNNDLYVAEFNSAVAGSPNAIARLVPSAPAAQQLSVFSNGVPTGSAQPFGIAFSQADGHIYYTLNGAGSVGYFTP